MDQPSPSEKLPSIRFSSLEVKMNWLCTCGAFNKAEAHIDKDGTRQDDAFDLPEHPVTCEACGKRAWLRWPERLDEPVMSDDELDIEEDDSDGMVDFELDDDE